MAKNNRLIILIFSLLVVGLQGCIEPPELEESTESIPDELSELFIPEGFEFGMMYKQEITFVANDIEGKPVEGIPIFLYTAPLKQGGTLLGTGITNSSGVVLLDPEVSYGKEAVYAYTPFQALVSAQRIELPSLASPITHVWGSTPAPQEGVSYRFSSVSSEAFTCQTGFYQVISGALKVLNVSTGQYVTMGTASGNYNGIGFNTEDNFIYGQKSKNLWRIDKHGNETDLGLIGGDSENLTANRGDFDDSGNLCVIRLKNGTWYFTRIDVDQSPLTAVSEVFFAVGSLDTDNGILDIAYNPVQEKFYGMEKSGHLVEIDPTLRTIKRVADYTHTQTGTQGFGAIWSNINGNIYFSHNESGRIYQVSFDGSGNPSSIEFLLQGSVTNNNDGASCVLASAPFDDSDDDGVIDGIDEYPDDPTLATTDYIPGSGVYGSYAFEDKWPEKGDFDFNDMVLDYNYELIKDASNMYRKVRMNFRLKTLGAYWQLGFGVKFDDVLSSEIGQVTGTDAPSISVDPITGVESGQSKAVIMVFDDAHRLMGFSPGEFVNAGGQLPLIDPVTMSIEVTLAEPRESVGEIHPFIYAKGHRYREIGLKGNSPTDLAEMGFFGKEDDASSGTDYYQTAEGMAWGLEFPTVFTPPREFINISTAYPDFDDWVSSNGSSNTDWYNNGISEKINWRIYSEED